MSANDIFEFFFIGLFLIVYLSHIPVMLILARKHDFRNTRFNIYAVLTMLPLLVSGLLLIFGPQDLGGRVALSKSLTLVFLIFAILWAFCSLFLFIGIKEVDRRTKAIAMISASASFALSCLAAIGASYVTL